MGVACKEQYDRFERECEWRKKRGIVGRRKVLVAWNQPVSLKKVTPSLSSKNAFCAFHGRLFVVNRVMVCNRRPVCARWWATAFVSLRQNVMVSPFLSLRLLMLVTMD
ncbi:unnamed protein product [Cuscuta epithymum]|uniref:Uncharacterized protein n=1 Tax=Cuscuta epithymum TaxID=186058 RepID=A0AAV0ESA9_9ASTE|nr:unnamed protein product [Cuscuta epithymum]